MSLKEKAELHKIWLKYLNTKSSQESDVWLNEFLAKFLHQVCEQPEQKKPELSCRWKNASNVLAHHLHSDLYKKCNEVQLSVPETDPNNSSAFDPTALQSYLLEGRGWILLWALDLLGIENVTCLRDLVNVLIAHLPVVLTFPVLPSNLPDHIQQKLLLDCDSVFTLFHNLSTSKVASPGEQEFHKKFSMKPNVKRKRRARVRQRASKECNSQKNSSSSSESGVNFHMVFSQSLWKDLTRICPSPVNGQAGCLSETEDPEDEPPVDSVISDIGVQDLFQYSISVVDYVRFVVFLLEKIASLNQKGSLASLSHAEISEFALDLLKNFEHKHYGLEGWSGLQIKAVRNHLLRLVFLSSMELQQNSDFSYKNGAINVDEIIRATLTLGSSIVTCSAPEMGKSLCLKDLEFICDVVVGILMLIQRAMKNCQSDYTKIIWIVRIFSSCDGINSFCCFISHLERVCDFESYLCDIFRLMKSCIIFLKCLRWQKINDKAQHHVSQRLCDVIHHHDNISGSVFSLNIMNTDPMCCIACFNHLILRTFHVLNKKPIMKSALLAIQEAGICCCIDPDMALNIFFSNFGERDIVTQFYIISTIESTIFPQLGFKLNATSCSFCEKHRVQSAMSPLYSEITRILPLTEFSEENFHKIASTVSKWKLLSIYSNLVRSVSVQSIVLVTKHLSYIFTHCIDCVRKEIFMRAVLSQLFQLVFQLRNEGDLPLLGKRCLECFLLLLPCSLSCKMTSEMFIHFGGIRVLYELLFFPSYRVAALLVLEGIIITECKTKTSLTSHHTHYETDVCNPSALVLFSDIVHQYTLMLLQKSNQGNATFASSSTERNLVAKSQEIGSTSPKSSKEVLFVKSQLEDVLNFCSDLWHICRNVILHLNTTCSYFMKSVLSNSYDLYLTLLKSMAYLGGIENSILMEKVLLLIQNLLIVFLHAKRHFPESSEQIPPKFEILNNTKAVLMDYKPQNVTFLKSVLHVFLQCSLYIPSLEKRTPRLPSVEKNWLLYTKFLDVLDISSTFSVSDSDSDPTSVSYDGDSEKSDGDETLSNSGKVLHCNKILHGEIITVLFDLLISYSKVFDVADWSLVAMSVCQTLLKVCEECESNRVLLCKQGFCSQLLDGFFNILSVNSPELQVLQMSIMDLFVVLSKYSINTVELKKVIELFKLSSPPYNILVKSLNLLANINQLSSYYSVPFPLIQSSLKQFRSDSKRRNAQCLDVFNLYRKHYVLNAWKFCATIFPLSEDTKWSPLRRSFSFTLWIKLENSGDTCDPGRFSGSEDVEDCYHVVSVGSDTMLLEMWINENKGDIIFRLNTYFNGKISRLAKATCHCLLKRGSWNHIAVNYKDTYEKKYVSTKIEAFVDALKKRTVNVKYENLHLKQASAHCVLLGHSTLQEDSLPEKPTFHIGSFSLFKGDSLSTAIVFYLMNLGPDATNFAKTALKSRQMFYPQTHCLKMLATDWKYFSEFEIPSLEPLQKNLLLVYTAEKPTVYASYPQTIGIIYPLLAPFSSSGNVSLISQNDSPSDQEPELHKVISVGQLKNTQCDGFFAAVQQLGGIPVFLLLFARVIECCDEKEVQALSLKLLLRCIFANNFTMEGFFKSREDHVLQQLLLSKQCILSHHMLKVFLDSCLSSSIIKYTPWISKWTIDSQIDAIIVNPMIWLLLIKSFLYSKTVKEDVQASLIKVINILLRNKHPYQHFNMKQMNSVNMLDLCISLIKENFILSDRGFSSEVANGIPMLIKNLLWHPNNFQQLWSLCNLLLLLHKASDTYVCQSKSSFYFLSSDNANKMREHATLKVPSSSLQISSSSSSFKTESFETSSKVQSPFRVVKSMTDLTDLKVVAPQMERISSCSDNLHSTSDPEQSNLHACKAELRGDLEEHHLKLFVSVDQSFGDFDTTKEFSYETTSDTNSSSGHQIIVPECFDPKDDQSGEDSYRNVNNPHFTEVYVGLLHLIRDIVMHSDEDSKTIVLDVVQPEVLIVLANNTNAEVCSAVIEIIHAFLQVATEEKLMDFLAIEGFHLLANQLHQLPSNSLIIGNCLKIMFCAKNIADDMYDFNRVVANSLRVMSWFPLFSVLPSTVGQSEDVDSALLISFLNHAINEKPTIVAELTKNGVIESLAKLVSNLCHACGRCNLSSSNAIDDPVLSNIFTTLHLIASDLFSSKDSIDFSAFHSMIQLFFTMELQCCEKCGPDSLCLSYFRDCQCVIFQSALDFIDLYNYHNVKGDSKHVLERHSSLWEILVSMPESLNPYSSFISASVKRTLSMEAEEQPQDLARHDSAWESEEPSIVMSVGKSKKELPMFQVIDRFQFILTRATDFIVFRDPLSTVTQKQKLFLHNIILLSVRGLSTLLEKKVSWSKAKWLAVIWSAKDSLRLQLSRLLIASLAPEQDAEQKFFVLETLANQPKFSEILTSILLVTKQIENLTLFLSVMHSNQDYFTDRQSHIFHTIFSHLKQTVQDMDLFGQKDVAPEERFEKEKSAWIEERQKWIAWQRSLKKMNASSLDKLAKHISEIAMDITKKVVNLQSIERKKFWEEVKLKNSEEVSTHETWQSLVDNFTHERAVWFMKESYPCSWEIDPTEGPQRIRKRLRRCFLNIQPKFLMKESLGSLAQSKAVPPFVHLFDHDNVLLDTTLVANKLYTNEKIEYTCPCRVVMAFEEASGEILIGDHFLHFIGEKQKEKQVISECWPFDGIKEIMLRRYELQNHAFEIFMKNGMTSLVALTSVKDLEIVWNRLENHKLPCITKIDASQLTQLWRDRSITNFEYLMQLNKLAGRSFNDLMQYPVFPFVLSDYKNVLLDLADYASFRNLSKPIAIQHEQREEYYIRSYNSLKNDIFDSFSTIGLPISGPYHYGSHYSNSGTVLHFLVRLLPYTYSLIDYQDRNFDIPDRTFHSIDTSWQLVTKDSTSDVKELIPEFYFLPEFLCNKEGFDFGIRQTGERVHDVLLPPWCKHNPRLFIFIQRQALESNFVTRNLNQWIDLIFGFKQTGSAAINAINVFHPATYYGMDVSKLNDSITKKALQAMIKTVGQMPRQMFFEPHPMVTLSLSFVEAEEVQNPTLPVLETVSGLKWGSYVGSPSTATPNLVWRSRQAMPIGKLISIFTNDVFGLPQNVCLLLNPSQDKLSTMSSVIYIRSSALVSWAHNDGIVRIKFSRDSPPVPLLKAHVTDPVCLCASVPDCKELFVAHKSGTIHVYSLYIDSSKLCVLESSLSVQLNGHTKAITSVHICKSFSIVVTASDDKTCIIWDLNRLCYVRSIVDHQASIKLVCVSDTLGDIASVSNTEEGCSLKVHTINGDLVGSVQMHETITSLCFSTAPEGISVNVIACGMASGTIRMWSTWDLKLVREFKSEKFLKPITSLIFSADNQHLYAANMDSVVAVWEKPSKLLTSIPRFLMFS